MRSIPSAVEIPSSTAWSTTFKKSASLVRPTCGQAARKVTAQARCLIQDPPRGNRIPLLNYFRGHDFHPRLLAGLPVDEQLTGRPPRKDAPRHFDCRRHSFVTLLGSFVRWQPSMIIT